MKPHKRLFFITFILFWPYLVKAENILLRNEEKLTGNQLSLGYSNSVFMAERGTIQGGGVSLDYTHYFISKFSTEFFFTSALDFNKKINSRFTGFGGNIYYSLHGQCFETKNNIYVNEMLAVSEITNQTNCFRAGMGLQQYFLNGTNSSYSGIGIGVNAAYHFNFFDYYFKLSSSYSIITSGKVKLNHINIGLSYIISL